MKNRKVMKDVYKRQAQRDALKDHVRSENGRVSAQKMLAEVMEIFESKNKSKN